MIKLHDPAMIAACVENMANIQREILESRNMALARIVELEREASDIEHEIERARCLYADRARLATKWKTIRAERRALKDWLHKTKRIVNAIESQKGEASQKWINELLGIVRGVAKQGGGIKMKRFLLWIANKIHQKYGAQRVSMGDRIWTQFGCFLVTSYSVERSMNLNTTMKVELVDAQSYLRQTEGRISK